MEIWNHVFMQHQVDEHAEVLGDLLKNIDTGSSIERVAVVLQDVKSFFETDLFAPLLDVVQSLSGKHYGADERHDIAIRIIGEHARATAFLVADGVQLERGRGGTSSGACCAGWSRTPASSACRARCCARSSAWSSRASGGRTQLVENRAFIEQVLGSEEERFSATLRQGMTLFDEARSAPRRRIVEPMRSALDTFRFPIELTGEARRRGGTLRRRGRSSGAARGAAGEGSSRGEEGRGRHRGGRRAAVGVRRLHQPEAEADRVLLDSQRPARGRAGRRRRARLPRSDAFLPRPAGRSATRARSAPPARSVRDAQWAGPTSIMHVGTVASVGCAPARTIAEIDRQRREARLGRTPRPTSCTGP